MPDFVSLTLDDGSQVLFQSAESDLVSMHSAVGRRLRHQLPHSLLLQVSGLRLGEVSAFCEHIQSECKGKVKEASGLGIFASFSSA